MQCFCMGAPCPPPPLRTHQDHPHPRHAGPRIASVAVPALAAVPAWRERRDSLPSRRLRLRVWRSPPQPRKRHANFLSGPACGRGQDAVCSAFDMRTAVFDVPQELNCLRPPRIGKQHAAVSCEVAGENRCERWLHLGLIQNVSADDYVVDLRMSPVPPIGNKAPYPRHSDPYRPGWRNRHP